MNSVPELIVENCFRGEWWENIVKSKERRIEFLTTKRFGRVWDEFEKRKRKGGYDETVTSEMNDHNWMMALWQTSIQVVYWPAMKIIILLEHTS